MTTGDFDSMLEALSNVHRRRMLIELAESNPHGVLPTASVPPDDELEVETLETRMVHQHLPVLAEHEFIDWNQQTGTVMKGPAFEEVRPLIELLDDHEDELPDDWL